MMKTGIIIVLVIGGWAAISRADVKIPSNEEINAVETEMIKISDGARLILPKGMKTTKIGGQIIVEDPQAFLLRRIEELEKQLAEITDANVKLAAKVEELKTQDQGQAKMLMLEKMLADLTARQQRLEEKFAQLKAAQPATSEPLPSHNAVPFPPLQMPATSSK